MEINHYIQIDHNSETTLRQQIREQITWLIVDGVIKVGDKLPSIHILSEQIGVNLHTVREAYRQLEADGLVESMPGRGTHVIDFNLSSLLNLGSERKSHTIGIILPSWSNPFYHKFLEGVEFSDESNKTLYFLSITHDDPLKAWREIARLIAKGVDGLLIVSHDIDFIMDSKEGPQKLVGIPYVSVDAPGAPGYSVEINLYSAGYQAAQYLIEQGHTKIGLITYDRDIHNVRPINQGFQDGLKNGGIEMKQDLLSRVDGFQISAGEKGMQYFLRFDDPPSAVFAITDLMAIGAMRIARGSGLNIPEDLSIIGFNNIDMGEIVDPPLTTITAPSETLGKEAMKMLRELINGYTPARRRVLLPTSLIIRESTTSYSEK